MSANPAPGELWRHYKGNIYMVAAVAEHTETREMLVVYSPVGLYEAPSCFWVRPLKMWHDEIHGPDGVGIGKRRFEKFEPFAVPPSGCEALD